MRLEQAEGELRLAAVSDRFLAFCSDAAFFLLIYFALLRVAANGKPWSLFLRAEWKLLGFTVLLLSLYEALKRGNTPGVLRCGLRVVDSEGNRLSFLRSVTRAAIFPVSLFSMLGGLWAAGDPLNRCWHDFVAGSLVVEDPQARETRPIGRLWGVTGFMALCAFCWWRGSIPGFRRVVLVEAAQVGVGEVSRLERAFYAKNGHFTESVEELAPLSSDPAGFLSDQKVLFAPEGKVKISAWKNGYSISAPARDPKRTIVDIHGP